MHRLWFHSPYQICQKRCPLCEAGRHMTAITLQCKDERHHWRTVHKSGACQNEITICLAQSRAVVGNLIQSWHLLPCLRTQRILNQTMLWSFQLWVTKTLHKLQALEASDGPHSFLSASLKFDKELHGPHGKATFSIACGDLLYLVVPGLQAASIGSTNSHPESDHMVTVTAPPPPPRPL